MDQAVADITRRFNVVDAFGGSALTPSVVETRFLSECLKGNRDAVLFVRDLFDAFHFWDDLIDRDHALTDDAIHKSMYALVVEIPSNPFYQRHQAALMPLIVAAIHNWRAATDFERDGTEHQKLVAFVLRSSYVDILVMCAHLLGGFEWAQTWTPKIRDVVHNEGFEGFKRELEREASARAQHTEAWG